MASRWLIPLALLCAPLTAWTRDDNGQLGAALRTLMAGDARLQSIGWRLTRANAPFCAEAAPGIGLVLLDTRSFGDPEAIRAALGLQGEIAVDAVAAGSPAERAGLRAGEEVAAIGDARMADLPAAAASDYRRVAGLQTRIEQQLAASGRVLVTLRGAEGNERTVTIAGEPACRSRFELSEDGKRAMAEGTRVIVSRAALDRNPDEDEAAALVAHELAHNILHHPRHLDATGRSAAAVAATEREADRLAVWLMANAGYDPAAGVRFAANYLRRIDPGLFRVPTHDGWRARQALFRQEAVAVAQARAAQPGAALDWRPHFPQ